MEVPSSLNQFEIVTLKSGIKSLRSLDHQETFHPTTGPLGEATILHTEQQRLVERSSGVKKFVIWDVGFGAAANVIAAIEVLKKCNLETEIELHSFDKTTAPIEFALSHASELEYLVGYESSINELILNQQVQLTSRMRWQLHLGDFSSLMKQDNRNFPPPNTIFYDPYSAATNPEMWTLEHFKSLHQNLDPKEECLLTNYSRSTAVRVALLLAGFFVGTGCVIGEKAETTLASNHLEMLKKPLERAWLDRVRYSTNAAPLRTRHYSKSMISPEDFEKLQRLPQFQQA